MRLLLVSNRLPVTVRLEKNKFNYETSAGGLATGVSDYLEYAKHNPGKTKANSDNCIWIGWPGVTVDPKLQPTLKTELMQNYSSYPVCLPEKQMDKFYHGFCNKTLWPLFHYFTSFTVYDDSFWQSYNSVNEIFLDAIAEIIQEDDTVWVHDYHLLLLPAMLRKRVPSVKIGFFLHIPFPSFEIFRLLPMQWREKILRGLLGADLVGFHTYEYTQYFLHCVQRILGYEHTMGKVFLDTHIVKADTFPMGINYEKFHSAEQLPAVQTEIDSLMNTKNNYKLILSIDRLDYTKGILNRLSAYDTFLQKYPEWQKKVILILVVVPSRTGIEHYQQIKRQIDEMVGTINGKYGDVNWTPILYQYKFFEFPYLTALYKVSDIALITPLRDGMNLIAKEYVASRQDRKGVLILSEMTGAAKELGEAIIVNPNSIEEMAESIKTALLVNDEEQVQRMQMMQNRLRNYDIIRWAEELLQGLQNIREEKTLLKTRFMPQSAREELYAAYHAAKNRLLLLDYDGTLTPLVKYPFLAKPNSELLGLLKSIASRPNTSLVITSGRKKNILQDWFSSLPLGFSAEHGAWVKQSNADWQLIKPLTNSWKPELLNILQVYANRVPGCYVEDKEYSLCWHYRNADPEFAAIRVKELSDDLVNFTANIDLQVVQGNKVIEIRNAGVNKGSAALFFLEKNKYDFILAIGDDITDEDMFQALPANSYTIRVGMTRSHAKFNLFSYHNVIELLQSLYEVPYAYAI